MEQNLVESLPCTSGQNLQNGSHLIKKRSDPRFGVWPETQGNAPETVFFTFCECFFDSAFFLSPPRDRTPRELSKSLTLVQKRSKLRSGHHFEGKTMPFSIEKKFPIWMEAFPSLLGLETKNMGRGLFSKWPPPVLDFFSLRTTGRPPSSYWSSLEFF